MIYLATHGTRNFGVNPSHTSKGIQQIKSLVLKEKPPVVIVGTGERFKEILEAMIDSGQLDSSIPIKYSPFCGSADGLDENKDIVLVDGVTMSLVDYIGITSSCFDAWEFISSLPDNTLLCAGGELMTALGLQSIKEEGQLFELKSRARTGKKIS